MSKIDSTLIGEKCGEKNQVGKGVRAAGPGRRSFIKVTPKTQRTSEQKLDIETTVPIKK